MLKFKKMVDVNTWHVNVNINFVGIVYKIGNYINVNKLLQIMNGNNNVIIIIIFYQMDNRIFW
jgi:hypothetical protein